MKKVIFTGILIITSYGLFAQLNSSNLNVPASAQPVPSATAREKAAIPQPQNIAPAPNPVPPIYSGAEVQAAETQRQLIFPPTTPSGTQPVQKEPLSPIESTNNLQPNRPQREEQSRKNAVIGLSNNTNTTITNPIKVISKTNTIVKQTSTNNGVNLNSTPTKTSIETKATNKKTTAVKKKPSKI